MPRTVSGRTAGLRVARRDPDPTPNGTVHYFMQDHLGSTRIIASASGAIERESDYYPFGGERVVGTPTVDDPHKFAGMYLDGESTLYHTWARMYSPQLGRWLAPDPLHGNASDPGSLNRYAYVLNNPTNLTDPLGLDDCVWIGTAYDCGFTLSATGSAIMPDLSDYFWFWEAYGKAFAFIFANVPGTGHAEGSGGGGSGSGGGAGDNKSGTEAQKKQDLTKDALEHENLSDCLHKFFGPGKILTNANLPRIDASEDLGGGALGMTRASMVPDTGRATILIDKATFQSHPATDHFTMVDTYLHETVNALAIQRFTDVTPRWVRARLGPRGGPPTADQQRAARTVGEDADIGMQFEKCLHPK